MNFLGRNFANLITLLRILGIFLIFLIIPFETNYLLLLIIIFYTLICITDYLDGFIARKMNIVTDLGKILDPVADKMLVLIFLPLIQMQVISSFAVFLILSREILVLTLRIIAAKEGIVMPAELLGKIKTFITLILCGILLIRVPVKIVSLPKILLPLEHLRLFIYSWPNLLIEFFIWGTVFITIISFIDYLNIFITNRKKIINNGN